MAFCGSCGSSIDGSGKFCGSCGAPVVLATATPAGMNTAEAAVPSLYTSPPPVTPTPRASSGGGILKIVLIIFAVVIVLGAIGLAGVGLLGWRFAKSVQVNQHGNDVSIISPLGSVVTTQGNADAIRRMGVDIYPGAKLVEGGAAAVSVGGTKTIAADFETSDSTQQVTSFYKSRFPNAILTENQADHYSIVSASGGGLTTIAIDPRGGKTHISIAVVSGLTGNRNTTEESR